MTPRETALREPALGKTTLGEVIFGQTKPGAKLMPTLRSKRKTAADTFMRAITIALEQTGN